MKKTLASLTLLSVLGGLGFVQNAQATDVKFSFNFMDADARVQGYFIVDDSVLSTIYNGGSTPANGGLVDFSLVKEISLDYQAGEYASGGGHFTMADYSSLRFTSYVPLDFYTDTFPAGNDIVYQWSEALGEGMPSCGASSGHGVFAFERAAGSTAPTEVGLNCMAGLAPDVYRQPSLHSLYLDTSYVATPVPEPSTYALMAMGLFAVGFAARRRKS